MRRGRGGEQKICKCEHLESATHLRVNCSNDDDDSSAIPPVTMLMMAAISWGGGQLKVGYVGGQIRLFSSQ